MNKVSAARRLMALFDANAKVVAPLTAGMTAGSGDKYAELLQD